MNKLDIIRNILTAARLPENWDTYGAKAMDKASIVNAIAIVLEHMPDDIPQPSVVPTRDSGIQFEWHIGGASMELSINRSSVVEINYWMPDKAVDIWWWEAEPQHIRQAFAWLMQQAKAEEAT